MLWFISANRESGIFNQPSSEHMFYNSLQAPYMQLLNCATLSRMDEILTVMNVQNEAAFHDAT